MLAKSMNFYEEIKNNILVFHTKFRMSYLKHFIALILLIMNAVNVNVSKDLKVLK